MRLSSQRILPFVLVLTLALCMAPSRALGITNLLAEIMNLVLGPFAMAGNHVAQWIRPASLGLEGAVNDPEWLQHVQQERDEFERLYVAEQAKVDALQQQLEQLQMMAGEQFHVPVRLLVARIAVRSPEPLGTVTLNRGSRHGVHVGAIAAYNAVQLMGKVTHASNLQSELLPLANPSVGLVDAVIIPRDRRDIVLAKLPRVQLLPQGDGTLRGDVDRIIIVNEGDLVQLLDDNWPQSAQGMVVGRVEAVEAKESEPLRNAVIVRPQYHVSQVAYVTLKIELDETATQSSRVPGGGAGEDARGIVARTPGAGGAGR